MGTKKMPNLFKQSEEKHTFVYRKLVVPLSMRSIYWKYFGFPANEDEEILTKIKIVCTLCKLQIAYNRNTSNLRMHLQNKHLHELQQLEENAPEKPSVKIKQERGVEKFRLKKLGKSNSQTLGTALGLSLHSHHAEGSMSLDDNVEMQYITDTSLQLQSDEDGNEWVGRSMDVDPPPQPKERRYKRVVKEPIGQVFSLDKDAVSEYMIVDLEPGCIVEGRGFQSLIATMRSPCEIPDKDKLEDFLIPKVYNTVKDALLETIAHVPGKTGLTLEEWTHSNGQVFVTIYLHYQSENDGGLEYKVLSTVHCSEYTDWKVVIDQLVFEWQLKIENVTAVVLSTTQSAIYDAFQGKGLVTIPCIVHSLQVCARLIFERKGVAKILNRVRCMVSMITRSLAASTALQIQLQINGHLQSEDIVLKMDYPRVWVSTYRMLETFRILKADIETIMSNIEGVTVDKEAVCLSSEDWETVDSLVSVLEPLKVTMQTLGEEKNPLVSLLKPLLWQLRGSHLKEDDSDSEVTLTLKNLISEKLQIIYSEYDANLILQTATALDPRFKQLPYESDEDKEQVTENIKDQLDKIIANSDFVQEEELLQSPKKSKVSGLQYMLGNLCTPERQPRADKGSAELSRYASEAVAPLDDCPPVWWARASARCPNLAQLAQKYTCVPAIAMPVNRVPVEAQMLFDQKRARIVPELVEKLLFLNVNYGSA